MSKIITKILEILGIIVINKVLEKKDADKPGK